MRSVSSELQFPTKKKHKDQHKRCFTIPWLAVVACSLCSWPSIGSWGLKTDLTKSVAFTAMTLTTVNSWAGQLIEKNPPQMISSPLETLKLKRCFYFGKDCFMTTESALWAEFFRDDSATGAAVFTPNCDSQSRERSSHCPANIGISRRPAETLCFKSSSRRRRKSLDSAVCLLMTARQQNFEPKKKLSDEWRKKTPLDLKAVVSLPTSGDAALPGAPPSGGHQYWWLIDWWFKSGTTWTSWIVFFFSFFLFLLEGGAHQLSDSFSDSFFYAYVKANTTTWFLKKSLKFGLNCKQQKQNLCSGIPQVRSFGPF